SISGRARSGSAVCGSSRMTNPGSGSSAATTTMPIRGKRSAMVDLKRWRAWLRAVHRDFGYCAIGFTVIYAVSGIAQNHIEDWGQVSYRSYEASLTMPAPADDAPDDVAIKAVVDRVALGTPTSTYRAGDEIRLEYGNGSKVTAIGGAVTI